MDEKKSQHYHTIVLKHIQKHHCPYFSPVNADKIVNLLGGSYLFSFCHTKEIYFYLYKAAHKISKRRGRRRKKFQLNPIFTAIKIKLKMKICSERNNNVQSH